MESRKTYKKEIYAKQGVTRYSPFPTPSPNLLNERNNPLAACLRVFLFATNTQTTQTQIQPANACCLFQGDRGEECKSGPIRGVWQAKARTRIMTIVRQERDIQWGAGS
jgi:hypothetical protein